MNTENKTFLSGHTSRETAYLIESYPYGRLRCKMLVWIETNKKGEQREVRQTQNPKTDRWNNPKKSTYTDLMYLYKDHADNDHIKSHWINFFHSEEETREAYSFIITNSLTISDVQKVRMKYALMFLTANTLRWIYRKYTPATLLKAKKIQEGNMQKYKSNNFENLFNGIEPMPPADVPEDKQGSYFTSKVYKGIDAIMNDRPEPQPEKPTAEQEHDKLIFGILDGTITEIPATEPTPAPEPKKDFFSDHIIITGFSDTAKQEIENGIKERFQTESEPATEPEEKTIFQN